MLNETPRSPRQTQFNYPVNPEIQEILDEVNDVLQKRGYMLQPLVNIKRNTPRLARYFINKYSKYLVPSFRLMASPQAPAKKKNKKKK